MVRAQRGDALYLRVLGGFAAEFRGEKVQINNRKCQALIAALAISDTARATREQMRGLLWSGQDDHRAQNNLRQALHVLTERTFGRIGFEGFAASRTAIEFRDGTLRSDLDEVLESLGEAEVDARLQRNPRIFETLLEGLEDIDPAFRGWLEAERARWQQEAMRRIERRLSLDLPTVTRRDLGLILNAYDPMHEGASQAVIRASAERGDIASALTHYQALWNRLDETFGEEPSAATQNLVVAIKRGELGPAPAPAPPALRHRPAIYVDAPELDWVAPENRRIVTGLCQDLTACLIRFREWRIIDLAGTPSIRREALEDGYLLSISVIDDSGALRLSVVFRDLASGEYVWSERIDLAVANWADKQVQIVRRLAVALNIHLSVDRVERSIGYGDFSLQAYDRWLRGQDLMMQHRKETWAHAEQLFDDMIATTPGFARAYSSRAGIENMRHIAFPGVWTSAEGRSRSLSLARRGVNLDPLDSRTQLALGWSSAMSRAFDQAELAFALAHQHNENDPWTMVSAAVGLAFCDRGEVARALSRQALSLDFEPSLAHWSYIAAIDFLVGDFEGCVAASEKA